MHALGDQSRRTMLEILRDHPASVTELASHAEDLDIVLSELGDHAVLIGAGSAAWEAWIGAIGR